MLQYANDVHDGGSPQAPGMPTLEVPTNLRHSRRYNNIMLVAGRGPVPADIMFISSSVLAEEASDEERGSFVRVKRTPSYLKGAVGDAVRNLTRLAGISIDQDVYYTALAKWQLPGGKVTNPKLSDCAPGFECLNREILEVKPKIIVTFGKAALEFCTGFRGKFNDIIGVWQWSETYQCRVMPMAHQFYMAHKPEWTEVFVMDLDQVYQMHQELKGLRTDKVQLNYQVVRNMAELKTLVDSTLMRHNIYSIDCEWHGSNHVDGHLRSLQICWAKGHAAYIRFMDDKLNYVFDGSYEEAGAVLAPAWNRKELKLVGHHISADLPWIYTKLKLDWWGKTRLDTEFAYQACNEHAQLGLERHSLRFSDLGRYEAELDEWKRNNKQLCENGYGYIPDEILIPYACLRGDSRVVMPDGSRQKISSLVHARYKGYVMGLLRGSVVPCRVTAWHKAKVKQREWFKLETRFGRRGRHGVIGPVLTPDHKVITQRGKVRVDELVPNVDCIATPFECFNTDQLSVFLASLLGDGGIYTKNASGSIFRAGQKAPRHEYLRWKARFLFPNEDVTFREYTPGHLTFESQASPYLSHLAAQFPRHDARDHVRRKLVLTSDVCGRLGWLGLAVWFQDDGNTTKDGECRLTARKLNAEEVRVGLTWFKSLGVPAKYRQDQGHFCWAVEDSRTLQRRIAKFMHPACAYKTPAALVVVPPKPGDGSGVFFDTITRVVPVKSKIKGNGTRYCLSVEGAENFLTDVGFVSNCKDVDVPFRAFQAIEEELQRQGMLDYYRNILNPFCTDAFTQFALTGLPMNTQAADRMRSVYTFAFEWQVVKFQNSMRREAAFLLARNFYLYSAPFPEAMPLEDRIAIVSRICMDLASKLQNEVTTQVDALTILSRVTGRSIGDDLKFKLQASLNFFDLCCTTGFNINSSEHKKLWLFDVKHYTPIKSTGNKEKGIPSMSWEKVMKMKPERRAGIHPAADKVSLQILSDRYNDKLLRRMLALTAVATVRKNLLKEPERDPETGMILEEEGLLAWVCSDGRVHGQMSLTETARPRAWKPNILNWSSRVQDNIADIIKEAVEDAYAQEKLPEEFHCYARGEPIIPIRSLVQAPRGMCMVESDYVTAEIYGLAYISGDENLIRILEEPDTQFAVLKDGGVVRLRFADDCGIPPEKQDPSCIMALWKKQKLARKVTEDDLLRHADGSLVHPRVDLHWSLVEMFKGMPREFMDPKADRGAGKVGNFSTAYGASPSSLERKIEADTGKKPNPGEGEKIIRALDIRQPRAQQYLKDQELIPEHEGRMRAASGKVRHFVKINDGYRVTQRDRESVLATQGREARNFPMQESVASTAGRAATWLIDFGKQAGLQGETFVCLYDSLVTLCPNHERHIWKKAHLLFMSLTNGWEYHNRILRYKIETEFNIGWSLRPPEWQQKMLDGRDYLPTPPNLAHIEAWLDKMIQFFSENESASLNYSGLRPSPAV